MTDFDWTDEAVATARRMWGEGKSAGQIATAIHCASRNAVIGKLHRLGLARGLSRKAAAVAGGKHLKSKKRRASREIFEQGKRATQPVFKIKRAPEDIQPPTIVPEPEPPPVPMLDLTILDLKNGMCRWPLGDGPFTFCGHKQKDGKVYCDYHSRIAYQPVQKREVRNNERLATRHG